MTQEELNLVVWNHEKWLRGEKSGERAILRKADLTGLSLTHANLSKADLRDVVLFKSDLRYIDLTEADLTRANLCEANLFFSCLTGARLNKANLQGADLSYANLKSANLSEADLGGARLCSIYGRDVNLRKANLQKANLWEADLFIADLRGADLQDADFYLASLQGADLDECERIRRGTYLTKTMIGYKKCRHGVIVTLEIPKGAIVFGFNKKQYRANVVRVLDFDKDVDEAVSIYDKKFVYRKGERIYPDTFSCEYNKENVSGIHFFRTKKEAEEYAKGE